MVRHVRCDQQTVGETGLIREDLSRIHYDHAFALENKLVGECGTDDAGTDDEGSYLRLPEAFRTTLRAAGLRLAAVRGVFLSIWA
jgi:hypothetical protein